MYFKTVLMGLVISISACGPAPQELEAEVNLIELPNEKFVETRFSILSDTSMGNSKRSVEVRLKDKVPEIELQNYALTIKDSEKTSYTRTFITYYLPDMKVGGGAWASTHFNPDLEVKVLGLSLEGEEKLNVAPIDASREVIGTWFDERPYVGAKITIFDKQSKMYIETIYKDGSGASKELKQKKVSKGLRLEELELSSFGEYWILTDGGDLEVYDNDGFILRYRRGA